MADYLAADTTVLSHLTKASQHQEAYNRIMAQRRLAVPFPVPAELLAANFGKARRKWVELLLAVSLKLPHSESTDVWYARVIARRRELRRQAQPGADAGDSDAWVIANSLEYGLPLLSHDVQQVRLGMAAGARVLTNLDGLKDDNPRL